MDAPGTPAIGSPLLVPFDGSANAEAVLPYVPLLVDDGREVTLLQVVSEAQTIYSPLGEVMLSAVELQEAAEAAARATLQRATLRLHALSPELRIEQVVARGEPAERIDAIAERCQARTILLASQGVSATGPGGFGSVVARVVRTSPVPVMIVPPTNAVPGEEIIARFVVAHDGSERAARALPLIEALARRLEAHVHVVIVVENETGPIPAAVAAAIDPHLHHEAQADALNQARRQIEGAGAQLLRQGLSASWTVLHGPAAPAILDVFAPRDVLVITSHGRSASRWMLGGVAEKLVRESPVPVILLRTPPDGTEEPSP